MSFSLGFSTETSSSEISETPSEPKTSCSDTEPDPGSDTDTDVYIPSPATKTRTPKPPAAQCSSTDQGSDTDSDSTASQATAAEYAAQIALELAGRLRAEARKNKRLRRMHHNHAKRRPHSERRREAKVRNNSAGSSSESGSESESKKRSFKRPRISTPPERAASTGVLLERAAWTEKLVSPARRRYNRLQFLDGGDGGIFGVVVHHNLFTRGKFAVVGYCDAGDAREKQHLAVAKIEGFDSKNETVTIRWACTNDDMISEGGLMFLPDAEVIEAVGLWYPLTSERSHLQDTLVADGFDEHALAPYAMALAEIRLESGGGLTRPADIIAQGIEMCVVRRGCFFVNQRDLLWKMLVLNGTYGHSSSAAQTIRRERFVRLAAGCYGPAPQLKKATRPRDGVCGACGLMRRLAVSIVNYADHPEWQSTYHIGQKCSEKLQMLVHTFASITRYRKHGNIHDLEAMMRAGVWINSRTQG